VQDAFEMISMLGLYFLWLTPMTKVGVSSLAGAERMTFLHPPLICLLAASYERKRPVDSITISVPVSPQGILAGSSSLKN